MKTAEGLTPREMRVVRALLMHPLGEDAAKVARTSLRTIRRYMARAHVRAALDRLALERLRAITTALARHAESAAESLGRMATGALAADSARVRACAAVIAAATRAIELEDKEARLEEIERMFAAMRPPGGIQ